MKRRAWAGVKWAVLFATLIVLTGALATKAWAQDDLIDPGELVGVYVTEPMENEITGETIVRQITLFDDTRAESIIRFEEAGNTSYEVGGWYPTPEATAVVFFVSRFDERGGVERAIEPPLEITFAADGETLLAEDALAFGPRDLILTRTDDEPESFLDDEDRLRVELRKGLDEYRDSLFLGAYRSQDFEVEGVEGWLAMTLLEDGLAEFEYPLDMIDESAVRSTAQWSNHGDGSIDLAIVADLNAEGEIVEEYDPPQHFSDLERLSSGGLVTRDFLLPDGSELIFSRADLTDTAQLTETVDMPDVAGVYAAAVVTDDFRVGALLYLNDEGDAQMVLSLLDPESMPLGLVGVWAADGDQVTVSLTHAVTTTDEGVSLTPTEEYPPRIFTLMADGLYSDEGNFVRLNTEPPASEGTTGDADDADSTEEDGAAGSNSEESDDGNSEEAETSAGTGENVTYMVDREHLRAGHTVVLSLFGDGSAAMSTQLVASAPTVVELGAWSEEDGTVTVELTRGVDNVEYDEPHVLVFERSDERTLTAVEYAEETYGEGLILFDTRDY